MTARLFLDQPYETAFDAAITAVAENAVALDRTLFYAASGGQPGDLGLLRIDGRDYRVTDTRKDAEGGDKIWHILETAPDVQAGATVSANLDWQRRHAHMRMHTALHLLCALIKGDVTGGSIGAEKSRLDFNIENGSLDKDELTAQLKHLIAGKHDVTTALVDEAELDRNPGLVRTLSVKPPRGSGVVRFVTIGDVENPVDRQPCGGTHVKNTSEIGAIGVVKIENKGKMNKRVILAFD